MTMRVVHLLRKCNPDEWGGTESAIQRLVDGLQRCRVTSVVYCPKINGKPHEEPLAQGGCTVRRFRAFVPVWGISRRQRQQLISVGGNLMSFDLPGALWREPDLSVIHTHALGRLGGIASVIARRRHVPLVATIHGGYLDLPESLVAHFRDSAAGGWEWGKAFGFLVRSRQLLDRADAILTCNPREAALLRERAPWKRIGVQPHGVPTGIYHVNHREAALCAFPQLAGRDALVCVGRIDPVKNQGWLVQQAPALFDRHPRAMLVFAGACTDQAYGESLEKEIQRMGLTDRVVLTGGFQPADPRLIGLFQLARAVIVPSISETFGLVILEAWAAGTAVISSRTSGASALICHGHNGWFFDLGEPGAFHEVTGEVLRHPEAAREAAAHGAKLVSAEYDTEQLAAKVKKIYEELIEEQHALRDCS
jgi:starch synthase